MNTDYLNPISNQNLWSTKSPSVAANQAAAAAKVKDVQNQGKGNAKPEQAVQNNTDRAEFSQDTKVTGKMTDAQRKALVDSLKADLDNQMNRFTNMMTEMFQKQGITGLTAGSDDFWKTIASGNYMVDAQTKADAQNAISEDGYWGVKKTSERIFDFAKALAGDDVNKMEKMQKAVEKGFKQAEKAWGGEMPGITGDTKKAIDDLFSAYYAEVKGTDTEKEK